VHYLNLILLPPGYRFPSFPSLSTFYGTLSTIWNFSQLLWPPFLGRFDLILLFSSLLMKLQLKAENGKRAD